MELGLRPPGFASYNYNFTRILLTILAHHAHHDTAKHGSHHHYDASKPHRRLLHPRSAHTQLQLYVMSVVLNLYLWRHNLARNSECLPQTHFIQKLSFSKTKFPLKYTPILIIMRTCLQGKQKINVVQLLIIWCRAIIVRKPIQVSLQFGQDLIDWRCSAPCYYSR